LIATGAIEPRYNEIKIVDLDAVKAEAKLDIS
jgi:hypothetical protein